MTFDADPSLSAYTPGMRADPLRHLSDELDTLRANGLFRAFRVLDGEQQAHPSIDGRSVVNLSSTTTSVSRLIRNCANAH